MHTSALSPFSFQLSFFAAQLQLFPPFFPSNSFTLSPLLFLFFFSVFFHILSSLSLCYCCLISALYIILFFSFSICVFTLASSPSLSLQVSFYFSSLCRPSLPPPLVISWCEQPCHLISLSPYTYTSLFFFIILLYFRFVCFHPFPFVSARQPGKLH